MSVTQPELFPNFFNESISPADVEMEISTGLL